MRITDIGKHKKLMEAVRFITEEPQHDELESMKSVIATKIKELPEDDATVKALREIEDLLKHIHAGGKMGMINGELARIEDPTVTAAQKLLARYIMSLDMTPAQRDELFELWRNDKLVNRAKLIKPGKHTFDEIITSYNSNPIIKELVDDLMRMATLGQGKGEFGLSVLSKNINKPSEKGDLIINNKKIECKTTDGGAGRFTDQEVRPGEGFEVAARTLNGFLKERGFSLPTSGLSLAGASDVLEQLETKDQKQFLKLVDKVIKIIFNSTQETASIIEAIKNSDPGAALQEYAKANFNYYMSMKDDEGVLYIDLTKEPILTVFFTNADELASSGLRLHAGTVYITSIKDVRLPFPQIEIVTTTFGANRRAKEEKAAAKAAKAAERLAKQEAKAQAQAQAQSRKLAPAPATRKATDKTAGMRKLK